MKTYLFDSLARFKRFSENLDIATTLSNKTWVVFNDSGERELYIFQTDGSVYITTNGIGYQGTWKWLPANQSLIIHRKDTVFMLHPQIVEKCVLVLTLDGTKDCVFLIEDQNRQNFAPKTLTQLQNHFEEKERKVLEAENAQKRREEQARLAAFLAEEKKRKAAEKAERERQEEERQEEEKRERAILIKRAYQMKNSFEFPWIVLIVVEINIFPCIGAFAYYLFFEEYNNMPLYISIPSVAFIVICLIAIFIITCMAIKISWKNFRKEYIAKHPDDPVCKYLPK